MKSGQNPRLHNILWQKCKHVRQTKKSLFIGEENYCPLMKNARLRKCYTFEMKKNFSSLSTANKYKDQLFHPVRDRYWTFDKTFVC